MKNKISVLIPAWNEELIITKTIKYLQNLELPFEYSEIIFIIGGTDKTYDVCKNITLNNFSKVIVLKQNPEDFKSGALIKGMKRATGDIITLIDADVLVSSKILIKIAKSLEKFDVVCCNFIPIVQRGFWYNYYIIDKLTWTANPNNLGNLYGGATISLRREVISEIGIENFFTKKTTAGVDYYMARILNKYKKSIGFVKNAYVLVPRPNNFKDFLKDQKRWINAFFSIHEKKKIFTLKVVVLNSLSCLFPPLVFLSNLKKMKKITEKRSLKIKYFTVLFFVEYLIKFMSILIYINKLTRRLKPIGHFKGEDRYFN